MEPKARGAAGQVAMTERGKAFSVLAMNTLAFTVCFAVWMTNGVLVTCFVDNRVYALDKAQMGWPKSSASQRGGRSR